MCDSEAKLGVPNTFALFMDVATEHAEALGIGATNLMPRGLFWLTVKTKVIFHERPRMMERVTVTTWPGPAESLRCPRYYTVEQNGARLIEGKTEWAVMEMETGKLHSATDIYPAELVPLADTVCDGPFLRVRPDFSDGEEIGAYTVRSTDIDLGGHMNNAAYVRAVIGAIPTAILREKPIREADFLFRTPCYEGDTLTLRRRVLEDRMELGVFTEAGKPALLVTLR